MPIETLLSFIVISSIIIIVPGPNVTLILATSVTQGTRAGLMALVGTTIAQTIQVTLVGIGLIWLLEAFSSLFEIIRWIGAAYLIYLGIQAWMNAKEPINIVKKKNENVVKGFLVGLSNPKSLSFFTAFFPQFINPAFPVESQYMILASSYVILAIAIDAGYAFAGGLGRQFLSTEKSRLFLGRLSGTVLVSGGVWLASNGRNT